MKVCKIDSCSPQEFICPVVRDKKARPRNLTDMVQIRPPLIDCNFGQVSPPMLGVPMYKMRLMTPDLWTVNAILGVKALGIK